MSVDQVAVRGDALRYYFSLSYNNNVLDQNSLKAHVHPRCIACPVLQKKHFA